MDDYAGSSHGQLLSVGGRPGSFSGWHAYGGEEAYAHVVPQGFSYRKYDDDDRGGPDL